MALTAFRYRCAASRRVAGAVKQQPALSVVAPLCSLLQAAFTAPGTRLSPLRVHTRVRVRANAGTEGVGVWGKAQRVHTSEAPEADVLKPQRRATACVINTSVPKAGVAGSGAWEIRSRALVKTAVSQAALFIFLCHKQ